MKKTLVAALGAGAVALAFAAKDPVIMTVNGVDVPKSEFEYLYNKNAQQQTTPQNLDEYVEMFKLYKMKVADAKAEGIDTLSSFKKETEQYRHDLAAPYLADSVYINSLVKEALDRSGEEVEAIHILLFKDRRNPGANPAIKERLDSIRKEIKAGADFGEMAAKYSQDRASNSKGGRMGFIQANTFPYEFEKTAYALKEGEISDVIESPVAYHVLKGGKHRPARGKVLVGHILKMTQNKSPEEQARAKEQIDSIYQELVKNPENFGAMAMQQSDDRGSARQQGMLPMFGAGEMVEEFDSVAFATPVLSISEPFQSPFGWHIIRKYDTREPDGISVIKPRVLNMIKRSSDPRYAMVRDQQSARLARTHKARLNEKTLAALRADVATMGLDSAFFAKWNSAAFAGQEFATIDGKKVPLANFIGEISQIRQPNPAAAAEILDNNIAASWNGMLVDAEEARLDRTVPDYHNLLKEYVDGSLLYEVSVRKVWDKAAKDTEGLAKYFEANKGNYTWSEPRAKGFLVQTANDSVAKLIQDRAMTLGRDTLAQTIRKEFRNNSAIDKVLVAKGSNPMVDNIAFGGPKVTPKMADKPVYFMIDLRVITAPEEVNDVKGQVTTDYQNEFQQAWEEELRSKYPVTVNPKVLKQVKVQTK